MEKLLKAQSIINSNVARMAESLTAQHSLGRHLHTMDNALDVRAKQYLRGMRQRAEEMFHSSMYHLVMSYRYEGLEDLPDSFVNYDRIANALLKLDRTAPTEDGAKSGKAAPGGGMMMNAMNPYGAAARVIPWRIPAPGADAACGPVPPGGRCELPSP